jgi:DNA-binding response OmpR family regulator
MKTILLVDDEPSVLKAWKRSLQFEGYRVVTANDGRAGLVAAHEGKPDLVITDWSMSTMDGVEFCRQLKRAGDLARIPVILTTADDRDPGETALWDELLRKPVSAEILLASIRCLLDSSRSV